MPRVYILSDTDTEWNPVFSPWRRKTGMIVLTAHILVEQGEKAAVKCWSDTRRSTLTVVPDENASDNVIGIVLNKRCGFELVAGKEIWRATLPGGCGNSKSEMAVCTLGAVYKIHSYKHQLEEPMYVLTEHGWEKSPHVHSLCRG